VCKKERSRNRRETRHERLRAGAWGGARARDKEATEGDKLTTRPLFCFMWSVGHPSTLSPVSGLSSTTYAPPSSLRMISRSAHSPNASVFTVNGALAVTSGSGSAAVAAIDSLSARSK
jgi:hypothetical protein